MNRKHVKGLAGVLALAALVALPLQAQEGNPGEAVTDLVNRMNQSQGQAVWDLALEAQDLGAPAAFELGRAVEKARGVTKVALAKARHVRVKGVMTKELKGPGPPHVTKLDLARAHAKAAGLTLPDYFEEQKKDDATAGARIKPRGAF